MPYSLRVAVVLEMTSCFIEEKLIELDLLIHRKNVDLWGSFASKEASTIEVMPLCLQMTL